MNTTEDVIRWIELNGIEYWKVSKSRGDKNDKVFETEKEESMADRKARFQDVMRLYPGNYFIVSGKKAYNQTTGQFEYEFMNGSAQGASVGNVGAQSVIQGIPKEDVQTMIAKALEEDRTKRELEDLRKQNKELQKEVEENGGAIGRILKRAEPLIGMFIDRAIPARPAVQLAGIERIEDQEQDQEQDQENDEMVDEETMNRIQAAIQTWSNADAEFLPVLEFIADFAATGKTIDAGFIKLDYNTVKGMLK